MMKLHHYPDNTSYWKGVTPDEKHVFKINSYDDLWKLNQWVDCYNATHEIPPHITIPWLIDGQADKRFAHDESSGLKLVCKFLNGMNATFSIFHPHNPEVVEALIDDVVIINNSKFIVDVWESLQFRGDIVMLTPDAGAYKWVNKTVDKIGWKGDVLSASKTRTYVDGKSKLKQQLPIEDFGGKDVLIIDDLLIRGGTMINLAKQLKSSNVGKIYGAVSHVTILNPIRELTEVFDKFFTTNSKFNQDDYELGSDKFKVINLF